MTPKKSYADLTNEERAEAQLRRLERCTETDGRGIKIVGEGYGDKIDLFAKPADKPSGKSDK